MTYTYEVIRDCGYGRVWTRLATDRDDAIAKAREWQREGRTDAFINGGDWFLRQIREVPNALGGFHKEPVGPFERFDD